MIANILAELEGEIGDAGIAEAKKISWRLLPSLKGTGDFGKISDAFGREMEIKPAVWQSACTPQ
jgi:hypothetical protein